MSENILLGFTLGLFISYVWLVVIVAKLQTELKQLQYKHQEEWNKLFERNASKALVDHLLDEVYKLRDKSK